MEDEETEERVPPVPLNDGPEEVGEDVDVGEEVPPESPPINNDSQTELPSATQEPDAEDALPFSDEADGQDAEPQLEDEEQETKEEVRSSKERPPPMAPPPAIFFGGDLTGDDGLAAQFGDDFLQETLRSQETRQVTGLAETRAPKYKPLHKRAPTFPFRAKRRAETEIQAALKKVPPRHEYCGYLFSSCTQRPQGGYSNYFLPIYPQPMPKRHVTIKGVPIPMDIIHTNKDMPKDVLPLSTIKVMWACSRRKTAYKLESIYAYLTRFGPIDAVYPKTINSVYVIFNDLEAAKTVVRCPHLGEPWDPLIASWVELKMYNSSFFYKYAAIENPPLRVRM